MKLCLEANSCTLYDAHLCQGGLKMNVVGGEKIREDRPCVQP